MLTLIGMTVGSAAMYQAMTSLGFEAESGYKGRIKLEGAPNGVSVLILGSGLAGMTAALITNRSCHAQSSHHRVDQRLMLQCRTTIS